MGDGAWVAVAPGEAEVHGAVAVEEDRGLVVRIVAPGEAEVVVPAVAEIGVVQEVPAVATPRGGGKAGRGSLQRFWPATPKIGSHKSSGPDGVLSDTQSIR